MAAVSQFSKAFSADNGLACYGVHETIQALRAGAVQLLLVSKAADGTVDLGVDLHGLTPTQWLQEQCDESGAELTLIKGLTNATQQFCVNYQVAALLYYPFVFYEEEHAVPVQPPNPPPQLPLAQGPSLAPVSEPEPTPQHLRQAVEQPVSCSNNDLSDASSETSDTPESWEDILIEETPQPELNPLAQPYIPK